MAIEIKVAGKSLSTSKLQGQITQGENNATVVKFILPQEVNGTDLTGLNWDMVGTSCDADTVARQPLAKTMDGDKIVLVWTVSNDFTATSGPLCLSLEGYAGDTVLIKFKGDDLEVLPSCKGAYAPSQSAMDKSIAEMRDLLIQAQAAAETAEGIQQHPVRVDSDGNYLFWDGSAWVESGFSAPGSGDMQTPDYDPDNTVKAAGGIAAYFANADIPQAFKDFAFETAHPIGSYYKSSDPTPPETLFGRGTWLRVKGRMLFGVDEADEDFETAGKTGGSKNHTLTTAQLPKNIGEISIVAASAPDGPERDALTATWTKKYAARTSPTIQNPAGGNSFSKLPPYETVYIWKRTE